MLRRLIAALSVALLLAGCGGSPDDDPTPDVDLTEVSRVAVEALAAGDPAPLHELFSMTLAAQLSQDALVDAWEQTIAPAGQYVGTASVETSQKQGLEVVSVTSEFSEMSVVSDLTFNKAARLDGLWFSYAEAEASEHPDPPVLPDGATEVEVAVGRYELPGLLTIPANDGPNAVVLLIAGSGPNDMDSTVGTGGNAILRDLAYQLAAEGIPTLRYDKRFHAHPELATAAVTIQDEVLDDAAAAVTLLEGMDEMRGREIVVLGHSLGGMLLPAILAENPSAVGGISMASTARSLWDVIADQNEAAIAAAITAGSLSEEQAEEQRATLAEEIARANALTDPNERSILGSLSAPYVVSINELHLDETAASLEVPLLMLHGGADFQVPAVPNFDSWKPVLAGNDDVTFELFDGLNHLFMPTTGAADLTEYNVPNVVAPEVSATIANWIYGRWFTPETQ